MVTKAGVAKELASRRLQDTGLSVVILVAPPACLSMLLARSTVRGGTSRRSREGATTRWAYSVTWFATFEDILTRFFAREQICGALFVGRFATLTGILALFFPIHGFQAALSRLP